MRFDHSNGTVARHAIVLEPLEARRHLSITGYWKLNESAGGVADDFSDFGRDGTVANGPTWQPSGAVRRGGLQFDGVNDRVSIDPSAGASSALSVAFWANASSLKHQVPIDKMPIAGSAGWNFKFRSNGEIWFRVGGNASFADTKFVSTTAYAPNTWVHVAATFENGTARLYTNGVLRATTTGITQTPAEATTVLRFGQPSVTATGEAFGGMLDDVRVYDHALTAGEVSALLVNDASLAAQVSALPATTQPQALKRGTLNWALEDATASVAAGLNDIAADTYDDVRTLLAADIGVARAAPAGLLPAIPQFSTNPLASSAVGALNTLRNSTTTYPKATGGLDWRVPLQGRDMAWGLTHPQSPLRGDSILIVAMFRRFQEVFESNLAGFDNDNFLVTATAHEMYRIMDVVHPDLILPSRKQQWEDAIRLNCEQTLARQGSRLNGSTPGTSWVNADVRHMVALRFGHDILDGVNYLPTAQNTLQLISGSLLPDGGFMYDRMQNEVYTYHGDNIIWLARYHQVWGDPLARQLVVDSYWYYPLSIEPNGSAEYSSGSSWKRYWNQTSGAEAATIVADWANSRENLRIARWTNPSPSLFLAGFFRGDLTPSPSPDSYFVYDRNVMGPRGRFGNFSFVGTTSPYTDDNRGKSTHVGAMVTDFNGTNNGWRINAALDAAQSRVRFSPDPDHNTMVNDVSGDTPVVYWDLSQQERNAYTVTDRFASLSTTYRLSKYKGPVQPWAGEQQWLFLRDRMIGMVSLESLADQSAYSMVGSLRLVGGRGTWGTQRQFVQVDGNTWSYGNLTVDLVEQNYGTTTLTYEDTWDDSPAVVDNRTGRINFVDAAAAATGESQLISYPAGTRRYYLVEVRPNTTTAAADAVSQFSVPNGLRGVDVRAGSTRLQMVSNPTNAPLTYTVTVPWSGGTTIHRAGQQHRPAFLNAYVRPDTDARARALSPTLPLNTMQPSFSVTIPAHQHVVLEPWLGAPPQRELRVRGDITAARAAAPQRGPFHDGPEAIGAARSLFEDRQETLAVVE